jgi:tetratricopeptide (TPR) repeat protein
MIFDVAPRLLLLLCFFGSYRLFCQTNEAELQKYYEAGEQALAQSRYPDAERAFEKLRQLSPQTPEVYGRLGLAYFQEGKFGEAVPVLRQALKLKPSLPNTDVLLAMCLSEVGHYEEAVQGLQKGFRNSSDQALRRMSGLQLVRTYTGLHRDREAVETALELERLFPDDPEILYQTSRIYANFAYLTLRKLSQVAPDSVWKQQAAAEADESQGNYDLAITEFRQVLATDPARRGIHYRIGRVLLLKSEQPTETSKEFELELQLDPTNANAAYELGELYRKSGQLDKAQQLFTQAIQYYPDFEEAQLGLGGVLLALGKPEIALAHIQKAIALNAANEVSYYRLSQTYKALGRTAEQRDALNQYQHLREQSTREQKQRDVTLHADVTQQQVDGNAN